ncbi:TlpA family protein disulfide reductase [Halarcobacter bivalviorum]|uniref:Protein disulfide reductase, TlpA family n=1 Tax=Halarcobacter bivalviorum TaxID=663364 RepID=A0AAX2AAZ8_9BACT|nr:TlpA disulfide reductase family protein [Halarcobacter bivalviorum]AXH12608.1 protein disulfide reductase, TlpA family [Halarcobacter bivalviorum]RXK10468.1 thioredoxin [Halarcobacter bivalviorum]
MQFKKIAFLIISVTLLFTACDTKEEKKEIIEKKQTKFILQTHDMKSLDIEVKDKEVLINELKGKVVLLNFWATWCPPCRAEIPHLNNLKKKYNGQFEIVGLNLGKKDGTLLTQEELNRFIEEYEIEYPITNSDDNFKIANLVGPVQSIPTMFLVDTTGKVVQKYIGIVPEEMMELDIDNALGK